MAGLFERLHEKLGGGSWLIGRVTGSEYAKADAYPDRTGQTYPREPWFAQRFAPSEPKAGDAAAPGIAWGIALDAQGKIAWCPFRPGPGILTLNGCIEMQGLSRKRE
jgi:hypothetical protein